MENIYNLSYDLQVNYTNESGRLVSIGKALYDSGVESKYIKVDDVCVAEETINGRVLSGTYEDQSLCCGYWYNYEKEDKI